MQVKFAILGVAVFVAQAEATVLTIYNKCSDSIALYDDSVTETIASGGITTRTLSSGFSGMFRNGVVAQATLAEFSITGGYTWYDISIIPTGTTGYPSDDGKTHSCVDTASVALTFCPNGGSSSTTASTSTTSTTTTTPAPTTATPTSAQAAPVTEAPTTAPVTEAPTTAPVTEPPTTAPVTEAPTTAPVTVAPTTAPVTSAPETLVPTTAPVTSAPETPAPTTSTPKTTLPEATTAEVFMFSIPLVTDAPSSSWDGSESSSSSSSFRGSTSGNTITFPSEIGAGEQTAATTTSVKSTVNTPTTNGSSGQIVSTEAASSGTSVGTIVASTTGAVAAVAVIAAIVVARRRKQQLDAASPMSDLEWLDKFSSMTTPMHRIPTF